MEEELQPDSEHAILHIEQSEIRVRLSITTIISS
jgi:hypothetical protein